jgi:hypothetical protein
MNVRSRGGCETKYRTRIFVNSLSAGGVRVSAFVVAPRGPLLPLRRHYACQVGWKCSRAMLLQPGPSATGVTSVATGCSKMVHAELTHHRPYCFPVRVCSLKNGRTGRGSDVQRARKGVDARYSQDSRVAVMLVRNSGQLRLGWGAAWADQRLLLG